ncbi:hypothetical protein [Marinigracilibium pacificum]|uniref:Uncharacterized protein n=1 Tax=Marinigracilibium pacificum TaxID=2729599 RepID=A0A848IX55_9BACT|nr:hypothetical protein [Marinigracilibium pacificum]NMM47748.1 hypothetical protein [Marinigracilibium pacificum]
MKLITKLSYLILLVFPIVLTILIFATIMTVGASGHSAGFGFFESGILLIYSLFMILASYKSLKKSPKSIKLRMLNFILIVPLVLISTFFLSMILYAPTGLPIDLFIIIITLTGTLSGTIVLYDNIKNK